MSTQSDRPDRITIERGLSESSLPPFAAFAVRTADDDPAEISPAETAMLHPRAVPERRDAFRLGRLAAHAALKRIGYDTRPILAGNNREPIWPANVCGAISHIDGIGMALVAPTEHTDGIGIDIESQRWAPELEDQVPRHEELKWLNKLSSANRTAQMLALFSAKEAVFKAFYPSVGRYFGFQAASLVPTSSGFRASLVEEIDSRYPATRSFDISCRWFGTTVVTWIVLPKT